MRLPPLLWFLSLTSASPTLLSRRQQSPFLSTSQGFHIYVLPSPSPNGTPSEPLQLAGLHIGAAIERATLQPLSFTAPPSEYSLNITFYQNATYPDSAVARDVLPLGYPMSLYLNESHNNDDDNDMPILKEVEISVAGQTKGLEVRVVDGIPQVVYGAGAEGGGTGKWIACREEKGGYAAVKFGSWEGLEKTDMCEEVVLVAGCASLTRLPQGALGSHKFVVEVPCLEGLAE